MDSFPLSPPVPRPPSFPVSIALISFSHSPFSCPTMTKTPQLVQLNICIIYQNPQSVIKDKNQSLMKRAFHTFPHRGLTVALFIFMPVCPRQMCFSVHCCETVWLSFFLYKSSWDLWGKAQRTGSAMVSGWIRTPSLLWLFSVRQNLPVTRGATLVVVSHSSGSVPASLPPSDM